MQIDPAMMSELREVQATVQPSDTLLVVDAMTGQEAAGLVKAFNEAAEITGEAFPASHYPQTISTSFTGVCERICHEALGLFASAAPACKVKGVGPADNTIAIVILKAFWGPGCRLKRNGNPCAGAVLTKMDGDSRGGAALSVKAVSGKPIKFVGTGEKLESLEVFYPDRIASRILGAHRSLCPKLALQQR